MVWVCQGLFLVFLYPDFYGMFGSSDIDLPTVAGDSVYSATCFGVPLVLCGIKVFLNFSGRFVYSSYAMFSQNPADAVSYSMDKSWEGHTGCQHHWLSYLLYSKTHVQTPRSPYWKNGIILKGFGAFHSEDQRPLLGDILVSFNVVSIYKSTCG